MHHFPVDRKVGLVGESGCGKSITSFTIMGLLPRTKEKGEILFDGKNLLTMSPAERRALRGHGIAMVNQENALNSLNPAMLIRSQMKQLTSRGGTRTAEDMSELVGLDPRPDPRVVRARAAGGQRQRVLIAMALTRDPRW